MNIVTPFLLGKKDRAGIGTGTAQARVSVTVYCDRQEQSRTGVGPAHWGEGAGAVLIKGLDRQRQWDSQASRGGEEGGEEERERETHRERGTRPKGRRERARANVKSDR